MQTIEIEWNSDTKTTDDLGFFNLLPFTMVIILIKHPKTKSSHLLLHHLKKRHCSMYQISAALGKCIELRRIVMTEDRGLVQVIEFALRLAKMQI
ncbi:CLUMA_CG010497, isoform A [Clunio marinus]|uniref:CLUMA_CG010497, isoform A n=1 Tax=Clunio marinus TaxID=568069 RepID=A0A1J1IF53_9DIPT|nr:CLUMA_CG010497, isoform A [Clunio marinus]